MELVSKKQNYCIDFLKGCACVGVLYMHTSYDCLISSIIVCLARFAVLLFFMISGYYCYNRNSEEVTRRIPQKCKHILCLCIISTSVYFVYYVIMIPMCTYGWDAMLDTLSSCFTIKKILNFILFNQVPFGGTLWFLFALLYCYFTMWIINKYNLYRYAYKFSVVLIFLHIITRGIIQYNNLINEEINIIFYRNFIFMGFPFFMIGNYIHRNQEEIIKKFSDRKLIVLMVMGFAISCVERFVVPLELYWGTTMATVSMYIFAVKNSDKKYNSFVEKIGQKYSMIIYISHPIVSSILYYLKKNWGVEDNTFFSIANPFIVLMIILFVTKIYEEIILKNLSKKEVA